jgi:Ca2+-binding EF-hand superfamily protein
VAAKLIKDADSDGDGSLSLDEVNSILKTDGSSSNSPTEAFGKLDSDGDGKLSASELSTALSAFKAAQSQSASSQAAVSA